MLFPFEHVDEDKEVDKAPIQHVYKNLIEDHPDGQGTTIDPRSMLRVRIEIWMWSSQNYYPKKTIQIKDFEPKFVFWSGEEDLSYPGVIDQDVEGTHKEWLAMLTAHSYR